jgi:predicted RND superfamily exporter protein
MKKAVFRNKQGKLRNTSMKRLFRIFELTKNQQRVVLIVMFVLIAIAFVGYERRVHHARVHAMSATETNPCPSPPEAKNDR